MRRKTKIVCTIGPSCCSKEKISQLIDHGLDIARINFSHATLDVATQIIQDIRLIAQQKNKAIAIIGDIQGPKIRISHQLISPITIKKGNHYSITPENSTNNMDQNIPNIPIDHSEILSSIEPTQRILFNDGKVEMKVISSTPTKIIAHAINGGVLSPRKGANFPDTNLNIDVITKTDHPYIQLCIEQNVDFIALSFIQSEKDVIQLKDIITKHSKNIKIISKIERKNAIDNIDSIIQASDAIMIARGDLGVEYDVKWVPIIQKRIIKKCREASKPVITATQMLESLTYSTAQPTRAECADIANAVLDGTDAVMLSSETASADDPNRNVQIMSDICRITELSEEQPQTLDYQVPMDTEKYLIETLAYSSVNIAKKVHAVGIATVTHSGTTPRRIAKYRPSISIYAFTETEQLRRQLNLVWGVYPITIEDVLNTSKSIENMEEYLIKHVKIEANKKLIMLAGIPLSEPFGTNMIKICST